MALSRQNLRRLSYLLEVAPINGSARLQCRASFCAQDRLKRWNYIRKGYHTSKAQQKTPNKYSGITKGHTSAASSLLTDTEKKQATPKNADSSAVSSAAALDRLTQILTDAKQPLQVDKVVSEDDVIKSLKLCADLAKAFKESGNQSNRVMDSPAMKLLFLEAEGEGSADRAIRMEQAAMIRGRATEKIGETAQAIVRDPKVFITPKILEAYVDLRSFIGQPEDLAKIFDLYASKLIPEPNTHPIKYSSPDQNKASFAVPLETAEHALDAAIATRNLPLCLDIIKNSVAKTAFKRYKLIQQALVPFAGVVATPFAAYAVANQFAFFQENLDLSTARWVGFAGVMSYIAFTGTIGYVALTTANDQMDRVVWQDGTPLRERWLREQERSMLDKVAVAWGFKDPYRKGEEEGPDWEALRELISLRGMILDKVELMEGMQ